MRLNINLATKPYQDVRRVLLQWGGLVLLLAVCTVALLGMAVSNWRESREVSAKIAGLNSEIAALNQQHEQALTLVRLPQNRPIEDDAKFLNGLIARKSFSWTRAFMQLEEIMPPKLRVVSIAPQLSPNSSTVEVHMIVAGSSRESAVDLVKRLEQSPSFRDARIEEESAAKDKDNGNDVVQFHLTAVYVPQPAAATEKKTSGKAEATTGATAKVAEANGGPQ